MLFFGIISLAVMLTVLLLVNGDYEERLAAGQINLDAIAKMKEKSSTGETGELESLVDSINIAVASQGFVIALFPIYSGMLRE